MIKGIIFDLDGVIVDTAKYHYEAWNEIITKYGLVMTKEQNDGIKGLPRMETLEAILDFNPNVKLSRPQMEDICLEKNNLYLSFLETRMKADQILPGVIAFLEQAKSAGLKMAIASSSKNAGLILTKLNILSYFDYISDPGAIKRGKPAPDIFLDAAAGINCLPSETIGLEDAEAGIQGLKDAKIFSVGIYEENPALKNMADFPVASTKDLNLVKILKKV